MIISKKMKRRCSSHFEQGFNNHGTTIYVVAQITQTMIDPMEWKQECERVAPRLEVQFKPSPSSSSSAASSDAILTTVPTANDIIGGDWRGHVGRARKMCDAVSNQSTPIEDQLQQVAKDVSAVQDRIVGKENLLNSKYRDTIKGYKEATDRLVLLEAKLSDVSSSVESQTQDLAQITAALNSTKKTIKEKGKSMTDMSPLVEIKTILQSVNAEIKDLDTRIGVMVSRVSLLF